MVHVNLMPPKTDKRKTLIPIIISGCFLGLIVLLLPVFSNQEPEQRPLLIEEREVVIKVLDRIEAKLPELALWAKMFRDEIVDNSLTSQVKEDSDELVSYSEKSLLFSRNFFNADSASQESSLMQVLVSVLPSLLSQKEEIGKIED